MESQIALAKPKNHKVLCLAFFCSSSVKNSGGNYCRTVAERMQWPVKNQSILISKDEQLGKCTEGSKRRKTVQKSFHIDERTNYTTFGSNSQNH